MKRKKFIYLSVVGAAVIVTPTLYCSNQNKTFYKALGRPAFLSKICDAKTLHEIGTEYIKKFPSEKKEKQLADLLLSDNAGEPSQTTDLSLINSLLDQKIKEDFKTGNTLVINGWILSITEARQCALLSAVEN